MNLTGTYITSLPVAGAAEKAPSRSLPCRTADLLAERIRHLFAEPGVKKRINN